MTKQEILDEFNDIDSAYNDSSRHETLSMMLDELLKEQEAVEPVKIPWLRSDGSVSEKYRCGSCDLSIFPSYKFCPFCGQAVKWE